VVSDYGHAAWLGQQQAITVLPSIASLEVLRKYAKASKASDAFAGFGNPLLTGPYGIDDSAATKQACLQMVAAGPADSLIRGVSPESAAGEPVRGAPEQIAGPLADLDMLRRNMPLPETADELCAVSASLGAPVSAVHLAKDATEAIVKQLSASGVLRKARVLHFATHGLMPAETQTIAPGLAEPALVLTPPASASAEDDGLLTAAEVTQLNLDADWVVLSACNTAAAGQSGEDLSGLARAFFYAGARALLVSHWAVESAVTVALITRTFAALRADPAIGRAEALRRAVSALITEGHGMEHPAQWAPFVVVGEGAAAGAR
jgi:CHAT domain-containing protein